MLKAWEQGREQGIGGTRLAAAWVEFTLTGVNFPPQFPKTWYYIMQVLFNYFGFAPNSASSK